MYRKPSVLYAVIAVIALSLGLLDYVIGRQPEHVYFLLHGFSLAQGHHSPFGILGNNLPSFVHVYAFILLTVAVAGFSKPRLIGISAAWLVIASLFEIAQHSVISAIIAVAVPAWFTRIPVLENTAVYFLHGTFDPYDLLSILFGVCAAYGTVVLINNKLDRQPSARPPHRIIRYLTLGGITLLGMLTIVGSGGGGSSGGSTSAPAIDYSQLYVSGINGSGSSVLLSYNNANSVSGNTAVNRVVAGGSSALNQPRGIAVDMPRNQLYVANAGTNSILVFNNARTVTGGIAPSRTISGGPLGAPSELYLDQVNDRLYVTSGNSVLIYDAASTLDGNTVTPDRTLTGGLTTLGTPTGITVDTTRNLLYVANASATNQVLVFNNADTVNGNVAPVRSIPISSNSAGIFVDVMADRLFVANYSASSITVFDGASTADSGSTPDRTLSGGSSGLNQPHDIFVDTGTDRLYVANAGDKSVLVFNSASTVNDPAAPDRILNLSNATVPWGIYIDVTPMVIGSTMDLDGYARSDGTFNNAGSPALGDKDATYLPGIGWRQLYSFDIHNMPTTVAITAAALHLYQCQVAGAPYTNLGDVIVDHMNYSVLNASTYSGATVASNIGTLSTTTSLGYRSLNVASRVQNDLTAARTTSQYRLRFSLLDFITNGIDDFVQFTDAEDSFCGGVPTNQPPQLAVTLIP